MAEAPHMVVASAAAVAAPVVAAVVVAPVVAADIADRNRKMQKPVCFGRRAFL